MNPDQACFFHPNIRPISCCSICEEAICEDCLNEKDDLHFCHKHFELYRNISWINIRTVKTSSDTPEKGHLIHRFKLYLWSDFKIQSFMKVSYEIKNEKIFTNVSLFIPLDQQNKVNALLNNFK